MTYKTYDEQLNGAAEYFIKYMTDQLKDYVPESGRFSRVAITFNTHYTKKHSGLLYIEPYSTDPKQRKVVAGVIKEGTDKLYSNIMATGTNEEIMRYLSDAGTKNELVESYRKLFASADED